MTIRINLNQLKGLIKMVKEWRSMVRSKAFKYYLNDIRKSGKKFKKEKKQKSKIGYPKRDLSGKVRIRRKQGFSDRRF